MRPPSGPAVAAPDGAGSRADANRADAGHLDSAGGTGPGRNELGTISLAGRVVEKIAAVTAGRIPDVGAAAPRVLGREISLAGARESSLAGLPRTSADVDGALARIDMVISVRWPAPVAEVCGAVRDQVCREVGELTGLTVTEVDISVTSLVTGRGAAPGSGAAPGPEAGREG